MPLVPEVRMLPSFPSATMLIDFVIVTAPNPPGSSTLISPPAAVFEIAPAKVLQGAVRLHGLASSPTPDTQVRDACALAGLTTKLRLKMIAVMLKGSVSIFRTVISLKEKGRLAGRGN